jgi:N-acyl-D-amino-acid deacylase
MECTIAADMGVSEPPGRENTMRWILGQPLDFAPNARAAYSNIGYLALGLIVEEVSGQSLLSFVRSRVATSQNWVPSTDLIMGRTFEPDQPVREVWYAGYPADCVFDNAYCNNGCGTNLSNSAYGAWDHEARTGQGRIVLSPATMLRHMDRYFVQILSPSIGVPLTGPVNGNHGGVLDGCNAYAWQRNDGVNVFMFFNNSSGPNDFGTILRNRIEPQLDAQTNWPTMDVEGFWVEPIFAPFSPLYGSYDDPYRGLDEALTNCTNGSSLNLNPGNYGFTGRIETRLRVRAPLGTARIGN